MNNIRLWNWYQRHQKKWQSISILVKMTQKKICTLKVKLNAIWMHATFGAKMFLSCSIDFCFCSIFLLIMNCKIEIWPAWVHNTKLLVLINMKRQKQIFCWLRYRVNAAQQSSFYGVTEKQAIPNRFNWPYCKLLCHTYIFIWIKTFYLTINLLKIVL